MELVKTIKEKWQKYLEEMTKANEKMWKGRRPSCCDDGKEKKEKEDDERR